MKLKLILAMALLGAGSCIATEGAQAASNWQFHSPDSSKFWLVTKLQEFSKSVEKSSGGELKISVFPGGSSGFKGAQALNAVSENLLPLATVYGGHVAGQEKIMELMDLPAFVPGDLEFRVKLWDTLKPLYATYLEKKYGVVLFDLVQINPRRLYTKSPVARIQDLKGLKIRALGHADADFLRQLGAEATTTAWGEIYTSLQQGLLDGLMSTEAGHAAMKFYEVTDHILDTQNAGPSVFMVVNKSALGKLSKASRKGFNGQLPMLRSSVLAGYKGSDGWGRKTAIQKGMKIHPVAAGDAERMLKISAGIVSKWQAGLDPQVRHIYDKAKAMIDQHRSGK